MATWTWYRPKEKVIQGNKIGKLYNPDQKYPALIIISVSESRLQLAEI